MVNQNLNNEIIKIMNKTTLIIKKIKTNKQKLVMLLFLFFAINFNTFSQNLVVNLINNTTQTFAISNIKSIKFQSSLMILKENNGTITSWDITNINNYSFTSVLAIDDNIFVEKTSLTIFPNPATNLVNIQFDSNLNSIIKIEIIDINGRIIDQIHKGEHLNGQIYKWNSNVQKGIYYCRLITDYKTITKPVIIN